MKLNSFHFLHLIRFHLVNILSNHAMWFFIPSFLFPLMLLTYSSLSFNSLPVNVSDLPILNDFFYKMIYVILINQFLNIQHMDKKNPNPRFFSESEFITILPFSYRSRFYGKIISILILFGLPSLIPMTVVFLAPHLQIKGTQNEIPLLERISSFSTEITWINPTTLHFQNGTWILAQVEFLIPILIIIVTLSSFYFLRKAEKNYLINLRAGIPMASSFFIPFFHLFYHFFNKKTDFGIPLFIWFCHWSYYLLGGLILILTTFIIYLGEKAEAREEF